MSLWLSALSSTALGLDSWVEVLYTLIDQDMYSLILHIGRIPDIDMSSEAYAQPHLAPIPLPLLTVFSNLREGDNLLAVDVNLFQRVDVNLFQRVDVNLFL